jgi:Galactosyltransferase
MLYSDFVMIILNCKKYKEKALHQKNTWLKEVDIQIMPYFHVIGDPYMKTDYVFDYEDHVLYVKTEDDYISLPKKVIAAYAAINKEYVFKYIFKTDDDQMVSNVCFFKTLKSVLLNKTPRVHYAGNVVTINQSHYSEYYREHPELPKNVPVYVTKYCSGRFYALSDLAVQQLLTKTKKISKEYFEDYAIGYHLDPIIKKTMLHINTGTYFKDM